MNLEMTANAVARLYIVGGERVVTYDPLLHPYRVEGARYAMRAPKGVKPSAYFLTFEDLEAYLDNATRRDEARSKPKPLRDLYDVQRDHAARRMFVASNGSASPGEKPSKPRRLR